MLLEPVSRFNSHVHQERVTPCFPIRWIKKLALTLYVHLHLNVQRPYTGEGSPAEEREPPSTPLHLPLCCQGCLQQVQHPQSHPSPHDPL